jgi:hypothetical protein
MIDPAGRPTAKSTGGTGDQVLAKPGHLLIMGQAGFLEHDDTVHGIRMFAREVYPRLKELYPPTLASGTAEKSNVAAI